MSTVFKRFSKKIKRNFLLLVKCIIVDFQNGFSFVEDGVNKRFIRGISGHVTGVGEGNAVDFFDNGLMAVAVEADVGADFLRFI